MTQLPTFLGCLLLGGALLGGCSGANTAQRARMAPATRASGTIESLSFATRSYVQAKDAQGRPVRRHGWSAFVTYNSDCRVTGSHLSGDPPFVHQDQSTLAPEALAEIWQAAASVVGLAHAPQPPPPPLWLAYEELTIIRANGATGAKESSEFRWQTHPTKEEPPPEVKTLLAVMLKYRVGGW